MGNKQEEMVILVELESCDLIAISETWWGESYNWKTTVEGYKLFRRNRQGRRDRGVALYVVKWIDCRELPLRNSHSQIESLRLKIRDQTKKRSSGGRDLLQSACRGTCWQGLLASTARGCTFIYPRSDGEFRPPKNLQGKQHSEELKQSRRLLESIEGNFLIQMLDSPIRVLLDLMLTNVEELVRG